MPMRYLAILALLSAIASSALASNHVLYECTDQDGSKQFTNIPSSGTKNCKVLTVGPMNTFPPPPAAASNAKSSKAGASPSPANFPRVDPQTQQQRDGQRRRILEQELNNEQQLLDLAKKDLAAQEGTRLGNERNYQLVLDRLEPYKKRVKLHEDNVANLRRELANMR